MFNGWKITNILDVGLCELDTRARPGEPVLVRRAQGRDAVQDDAPDHGDRGTRERSPGMKRFQEWVESGRFEDRFGRILDALESPTGRAAVVLALIVLVMICEVLSRSR